MDDAPATQFTRARGIHMAYATFGAGPAALLHLPGVVSRMDSLWGLPQQVMIWRRLASFAQVVSYDRRGVGDSDPVPVDHALTLTEEVDDAVTVLDAAGVERVAVFTHFFGGPVAIALAARHPDRVSHLALASTYARYLRAADFPIGMPDTAFDRFLAGMEETWGIGSTLDGFLPSLAGDDSLRALFARQERAGASPRQVVTAMRAWSRHDARPYLAEIHVPTLVIHPRRDRLVPIAHGRYLAEHIAGARMIELDSDDHLPVGDALEPYCAAIEELVTGEVVSRLGERALAAVMFLDVSQSTAQVARLGDRTWRDRLDAFRRTVRDELERHDGREVNTRGDDVLAEFALPAKAITCAIAIRNGVRSLGLDVHAGIHVGEVERQVDDLTGIAVHLGARISELAGAGEILVSQTVRDVAVGSGHSFTDRGEHELQGIPDRWRVYAVET